MQYHLSLSPRITQFRLKKPEIFKPTKSVFHLFHQYLETSKNYNLAFSKVLIIYYCTEFYGYFTSYIIVFMFTKLFHKFCALRKSPHSTNKMVANPWKLSILSCCSMAKFRKFLFWLRKHQNTNLLQSSNLKKKFASMNEALYAYLAVL